MESKVNLVSSLDEFEVCCFYGYLQCTRLQIPLLVGCCYLMLNEWPRILEDFSQCMSST